MYCFDVLCCVCLKYNVRLRKITDRDDECISYYEKITHCIPKMVLASPGSSYICYYCCWFVSEMYLFQARCLRNVEKVNRYVEALESGAGVNGKMVVNLGGCQKYSENYAGGVYEEDEEMPPLRLSDSESGLPDTKIRIKDEPDDGADPDDVTDRENITRDFQPLDIQLYKCCYCYKLFPDRAFLNVHIANHTGERKYWCTFCGKKFSRKNSLATHWRVHTNEQPFTCPLCSKTFRNSTNLKVHERVHTGERPYRCGFCQKAFTQSNAARLHETIHNPEPNVACGACGKAFSNRSYLKAHQKRHGTVGNAKNCRKARP